MLHVLPISTFFSHSCSIGVSNDKRKGKIPVHVLKTYGGVEVQSHSFLTLALDGAEWSGLCTGRFVARKEPPIYQSHVK